MRELPVPPVVQSDPSAKEVARVWVGGGQQHVTLATGLWQDPGAWGLLLVDLAKHVANAYAQTRSCDVSEVLARIHEALEAEWHAPTDLPTGRVT